VLFVGHLFRVPLHEQAESAVNSFEGLDDAVFAVSDYSQVITYVFDGLVVV
jgi:hypothetical protein